VRHPLYTGNIIILFGLCGVNGSLWSLITAVIFFWFYYPPAIEYEDRKLKSLFPETWENWANKTPALVPKLKGIFNQQLDLKRWSLKKSLITNYEPVIVIYVLTWLVIIWNRV
jgi:hypothetical protein